MFRAIANKIHTIFSKNEVKNALLIALPKSLQTSTAHDRGIRHGQSCCPRIKIYPALTLNKTHAKLAESNVFGDTHRAL